MEQRVYREVLRAITSRFLGPGAAISENELARYFDTSRTPIRNALRRLEQDRLVEIRPRRGTYVVNPSVEQINAAWAVRIALERLSVVEAAPRTNAAAITELREMCRQEEDALRGRDFATAVDLGNRIHLRIAGVTGNDWLVSALTKVIAFCSVHYAFYEKVDWDNPISPGEHMGVIDALNEGDGSRADRLMEAHLRRQRTQFQVNGWHWPMTAPWRQAPGPQD